MSHPQHRTFNIGESSEMPNHVISRVVGDWLNMRNFTQIWPTNMVNGKSIESRYDRWKKIWINSDRWFIYISQMVITISLFNQHSPDPWVHRFFADIFWVKQGSLKRTWVPKWLFYHIFPSHGAMFLDSINLMFKVNRTWVVCVISIGHLFFFGGVSNVDANVVVVFFFFNGFPLNIYIYSALFGFGVIFHDPDLC